MNLKSSAESPLVKRIKLTNRHILYRNIFKLEIVLCLVDDIDNLPCYIHLRVNLACLTS